MYFKTLKEKCEYYKSITDYRLVPNSFVIVMLDGRSFSKKIKKRYHLPFDSKFVSYMNETAKYLSSQIQGCIFAYAQSDEISLVLQDFSNERTGTFFANRLSKIQSICASMASSKFNRLATLECFNNEETKDNIINNIESTPLYEFDCKAWNVPSLNDVYAWFLYRQIDCIRNSKQQASQTYIPHKSLLNLNADEQIKLLKKEKCIDWNKFNEGYKYGRFIYKKCLDKTKWVISDAFILSDNKERFIELLNTNI